MRILHLSSLYAPFSYGGAERVVEVLAEGQVARGHTVAAAYLVPSAQPDGVRNGVFTLPLSKRNPLWVEESAAYPSPIRIINKICTVFNVPSALDFGRVIEQFKPDVVHTHSLIELPPFVWREAKRRGVPVVHTVHDYDLLCVRGALFRHGKVCHKRHAGCAAISFWKKQFQTNIDAVAAVSQPVLDIHRANGFFQDLPLSKQHVVWNPVPPPDRQDTKPKHLDGDFVFGFLGRIVEHKGISVLLDACRLLPKSGWKLRIAGTLGPEQAAWVESTQDLPIEWLGRQNANAFFETIDVLVVPAIWMEPFGLTAVEAYGAGVAVIGTRIGAIPEIVGTMSPEWLVPPSDPQALAKKMAELITQGRNSLPAPDAFDRILNAVRPEKIVGSYDAIYSSVLEPAIQN